MLSMLLCYCVCGLVVGLKFVSQTWPNNWVVLDLIKSHSVYFSELVLILSQCSNVIHGSEFFPLSLASVQYSFISERSLVFS